MLAARTVPARSPKSTSRGDTASVTFDTDDSETSLQSLVDDINTNFADYAAAISEDSIVIKNLQGGSFDVEVLEDPDVGVRIPEPPKALRFTEPSYLSNSSPSLPIARIVTLKSTAGMANGSTITSK